jgi:two-component system, sensor histidine kinase PdtaS
MRDRIQRILDPNGVERKRQEASLAVAIVADTDDAIIAKALDGTILSWNAGAQRIFGYTAAEMIGGPITRLFPPNRLHEEAELIARLLRGEVVTQFETQRIRKDGLPIEVSVTLSPIRDSSGKIVAVSKIARDVTQAHQHQRSLALAAAIIQHSDDAIIAKTLDGTVISWNKGAQRIFGYSVAEMVGGPITRLFPPDRMSEEANLITRLVSGEDISHFQTQRIRKDGLPIEVSVTLSPIRDDSGKIVAVSKVARDVTAFKRMQQRLGQVFEAVLHGLVVVDGEGRIEIVNRQLETMFGYAREELVGGSIERLMPERYRSRHGELFRSFLANPSVRVMAARQELYGQRKDGSEFPVEIGLNPVPSTGTLQVLATITDVTERKAALAQTERALQEKTTLLNEIHHRVKNNLQIISSLLKMQARSSPPEVEAMLTESYSRVRAMSLIHELLYEHGDLERIRLGAYLERLVIFLRDTFCARRKSIEVHFSGIDADVHLDIGRAIPCGLIVTELVTNSFKHAFPQDRRGTISVSLQAEPGGGGALVVGDDGIGIPETAVLGGGHSLGFRLLPSLAEQLGGSISQRHCEGARYELRFPK